tara:strand:+ start:5128 stop:5361 length:234 start_codon:yes stop_codon:yes gene_type:complete
MVANETNKIKKYRCFHCNKKIQIAFRNTPCECGNNYCAKHRLPENHDCGIDARKKYLETSESKIAEMKCVAKKIIAI